MKKRLVMIRHAKSSWANPLQSDYERPLNERGQKDAPDMGRRLKKAKIIPDLIIASTARRAAETAKRIARELDYPEDKILWQEKLYHCISTVFDEVARDIPEEVKTAFIVAHNPGITDYVSGLSQKFSIDNMPTCAAVAAEAEIAQWYDWPAAPHTVFHFDYPRK